MTSHLKLLAHVYISSHAHTHTHHTCVPSFSLLGVTNTMLAGEVEVEEEGGGRVGGGEEFFLFTPLAA